MARSGILKERDGKKGEGREGGKTNARREKKKKRETYLKKR